MRSDRLAAKAIIIEDSSQDSGLPSPAGGRAGDEGRRLLRRKPPLPESLKERIRELRTSSTEAEILMWKLLRDRGFHGAKFRRQHPIARFILDFYCDEARLGVELDGSPHRVATRFHDDNDRTRLLHEQHGIHLVRFWNSEVLRDTESVLNRLWTVLESRLASSPAVTGAGRAEHPSGPQEAPGTTSAGS
jgi:very-short-patch-repair endonuclease